MFVEFGGDLRYAGANPTVRSFVFHHGIASYVNITREELIEAIPAQADLAAADPVAAKPKAAKAAEPRPAAKKGVDRKSKRILEEKTRFKSTVTKKWRGRTDGKFLLAMEEMSAAGLDIQFVVSDGLEAAINDVVEFTFADRLSKRKYQIVAWFPSDERGTFLIQAHKGKLESAISNRLKDSVFSTEACYSDLEPGNGKSINQGIAEGTCVVYWPCR
jgi:hypothetical protein